MGEWVIDSFRLEIVIASTELVRMLVFHVFKFCILVFQLSTLGVALAR